MKPPELGPYLLLRKLAENPLCETYRAGQRAGDEVERVVLLYLFNCSADEALWLAETAQAGRSALRGFASPCLSPAIDSGEIDGTAFLTYDYIPGRSLQAVFEKTKSLGAPLPLEHALLITDRVAQGLLSAWEHESRALHGFVVPQLIMLSNEGEVQLLGMEVASRLRRLLSQGDVFQQMGAYLAPEVVPEGQPSTTDDVYSLGAILHEMVTGKRVPNELPNDFLDGVGAPGGPHVPAAIAELLRLSLVPSPHRSDLKSWSEKLNQLLVSGEYDVNSFNLAMFLHSMFSSEIEKEDEESVPVVSEEAIDDAVEAPGVLDTPEDIGMTEPDREPIELESFTSPASLDARETADRNRIIAIAAAALVAVLALGYGALKFFESDSPPQTARPEPVVVRQATPPPEIDPEVQAEGVPASNPMAEEAMEAAKQAEPELSAEEIERRVQELARKRSAEVETSLRREYESQLAEMRQRLEAKTATPAAEETAADPVADAALEPVALEGQSDVQPRSLAATDLAEFLRASDRPSPIESDSMTTAELGTTEGEQTSDAPLSSEDETQSQPATAGPGLDAGDEPRAASQPSTAEPEASKPEPAPPKTQERTPEEPAVESPTVEAGQLVTPGPGVVAPRLAKSARPVYPLMAQRLRKQAVVTVRVLVDEKGRVLEVERVGDEAGYGFDEAALDAARRSEFTPATKNGVRVKMWSTVRIAFQP